MPQLSTLNSTQGKDSLLLTEGSGQEKSPWLQTELQLLTNLLQRNNTRQQYTDAHRPVHFWHAAWVMFLIGEQL